MFFYLCFKTMILFLLYYYIFIILLLSYSQPMGRAGGLFCFNNQKWALNYKMLAIPNLV